MRGRRRSRWRPGNSYRAERLAGLPRRRRMWARFARSRATLSSSALVSRPLIRSRMICSLRSAIRRSVAEMEASSASGGLCLKVEAMVVASLTRPDKSHMLNHLDVRFRTLRSEPPVTPDSRALTEELRKVILRSCRSFSPLPTTPAMPLGKRPRHF